MKRIITAILFLGLLAFGVSFAYSQQHEAAPQADGFAGT